MDLILKAVAGAVVVIVIQFVSQTRNYYIAGLVPLFPTFAVISHYIVGTEHNVSNLKQTILFGILSLVPYFAYLISLYFLVDQLKLSFALIMATCFWAIVAAGLIALWNKF
jgi:uncharacterized membrane protein (GlpM family)